MQAEAEAAMREARRSRETPAKAAPDPSTSRPRAGIRDRQSRRPPIGPRFRRHGAPPPPGARPASRRTDRTPPHQPVGRLRGAFNRAKAPAPAKRQLSTPDKRGEGGEEGDDSEAIRRRDADFPALSPSAAAGKAAEKRAAPLIAAHKRAAETSKLPVGAKPFDPNMAKAILAGMRDGDPNEK